MATSNTSGDAEQPAERKRPVRFFFTTAGRGTSALLRMCIRSLGWKEEFNADIQRRCDELWGDTRQPRCLLWIDKMDRRGRVYSLGTDLALAVSSRLEGMKDVVEPVIVLALAWALGGIISATGTAEIP